MKAILMSIQSQHLVNILNGNKTVEIRKSVPKGFIGWVYLYCTKAKPYLYKGLYKAMHTLDRTSPFNYIWCLNDKKYRVDLQNGKIVARFYFDEYTVIEFNDISHAYIHKEYDTEISNLIISSCLDITSLYEYAKYGKNLFAWYIKNLEIFDKPMELRDFKKLFDYDLHDGFYKEPIYKSITKAPQSWQYVET